MTDTIHNEDLSNSSDDSSIDVVQSSPGVDSALKIYQLGKLIVVGFGGDDVADEVCISTYRAHLFDLIKAHDCDVIAFDLTGVKYIPSGLLGVLLSVRKRVKFVELYNPSSEVVGVLRLTRSDQHFNIKEVAI